MSIDLSWDAPGTGPWQQDSAHNPVSRSRLMQHVGVHFRVFGGFDVTNPTIGERPESIVGRIRAALNIDHDLSPRRADEFAAELRAATPEEDRDTFDDLLREARPMDRLRDERGLYSDTPSIALGDVLVLE